MHTFRIPASRVSPESTLVFNVVSAIARAFCHFLSPARAMISLMVASKDRLTMPFHLVRPAFSSSRNAAALAMGRTMPISESRVATGNGPGA